MLADGAAFLNFVHVDRQLEVLEGERLPHRQLAVVVHTLLQVEAPSKEAIECEETIDDGLRS